MTETVSDVKLGAALDSWRELQVHLEAGGRSAAMKIQTRVEEAPMR
ncbi:MAG: hypothetical protein ACTHNQ_15240 [Microbacterium sp.]